MTTQKPTYENVWAAFAAAQADFQSPKQSGWNPHFKSNYSTLGDIFAATLPALHKHGLIFTQIIATDTLLSQVVHAETGDMFQSTLPITIEPNAQKFGSLLSYYKRYAAAAMFAVVDGMDDDAETATNGTDAPQRTQPQHTNGRGNVPQDAPTPATDESKTAPTKSAYINYHELGTALHGKDWDAVRAEQVKVIGQGAYESSKELTAAELKRLTAGMAAKLAMAQQPDQKGGK